MNLGKQLQLGNDLSKEEILQRVAEIYKTDCICSYEYMGQEPKTFESKSIEPKISTNPEFQAYNLYLLNLAQAAILKSLDGVKDFVRKEIEIWNEKDGLSLYLAVLNWSLLSQSGLVKDEDMNIVQGYYKYAVQGVLAQLNEPDQIGPHVWLSMKGSVLDFVIKREISLYDFSEGPYIIGKIPEGLELIGWEEPKATVKQYARQIAKESGMAYFDWVLEHRKYANELVLAIRNQNRE